MTTRSFSGLHDSTLRAQGALSNHKNLLIEPADHAIGRSRGGLSTKVHQLVDTRGLPLVVLIGPGQGGDSPMLPALLTGLRVARLGPGRPRTTPDALLGDKAYSSRATRAALRARGIAAVIAEPANQAGHRKRRGSKGGGPPSFDPVRYKDRNVIERYTRRSSGGAPWPPATTSSPSPPAPGCSSAPSSYGCKH